jgi:hypothetical protein
MTDFCITRLLRNEIAANEFSKKYVEISHYKVRDYNIILSIESYTNSQLRNYIVTRRSPRFINQIDSKKSSITKMFAEFGFCYTCLQKRLKTVNAFQTKLALWLVLFDNIRIHLIHELLDKSLTNVWLGVR